MDLLAHAVYGVTVCSRSGLAGGRSGFRGGRWYRDRTLWWAVAFSLLPDALSMWTPFAIHVASGAQGNFFVHYGGGWLVVYRCAHSLAGALAVLAAVYFLRRDLAVPSLAWAVHVACDAVSHNAGKFGTMPLYPFSRWMVDGIPFWRNRWFVLTYWGLLAATWIVIAASRAVTRSRP